MVSDCSETNVDCNLSLKYFVSFYQFILSFIVFSSNHTFQNQHPNQYILTSFKHILYFLKYITNLHRDQPVHLLLLYTKDWYRIRVHLNYMVLCVEIKMSPIQNVPLLRKLL